MQASRRKKRRNAAAAEIDVGAVKAGIAEAAAEAEAEAEAEAAEIGSGSDRGIERDRDPEIARSEVGQGIEAGATGTEARTEKTNRRKSESAIRERINMNEIECKMSPRRLRETMHSW